MAMPVLAYASIEAIVTAARGNVNAHQEIKNFRFMKFLYMKKSRKLKNRAKL